MFAKTKASKLAQRSFGALRLTRSFLLLEDDYDVDWEVDRDEQLTQHHPHRVPLRGPGRRSRRATVRRAGQGVPTRHICISPVNTTPDLTHASHERPPCTRPHAQRSRH
jgi:hypothetical protein